MNLLWPLVMVLFLTNLATIILLLRTRYMLKKTDLFGEPARSWLAVSETLKHATGALLLVRKLDPDQFFWRESSR